MHISNPIQQKKVGRLNRLIFFCSLFIFIIALGSCSSPEDKQANSEQTLSAQNLTKTTIPIEGMTCNACVASIKKELKSLDALERVEVSLEHRNATVFYEEGTITPLQIQQAINAIGYKAGKPVTEESRQ
jgi:copper chaperone CopZ